MASGTILIFLTLSLGICGQFDFVENLPPAGGRNVVYTRYIRRRPIPYSNNYVREVIEVFNTQRRPPPYAFLHDEDLTRFVRCDFDPSMPDCDGETHTAITTTTPAPRTSTSTTTEETDVSSTPLTASTTSTSSFWWGRTSEITTTTTTEQNIKLTENDQELPTAAPTVPQETTSTTKSPMVSEEYGEDNSEGANGNAYDDAENNNEANSTDTGDPSETEYYDEVEKGASNSEEATHTESSEAEVEAQTQETTAKPTKKSFLNWF